MYNIMAESASSMCRLGVGQASLEYQLSKFPAQLLDRPCGISLIGKLVHNIDTETMVMMATDLELSAVEVDDIQTAWPRKPVIQRLEMFKKWQEKRKSQATYRSVTLLTSKLNLTPFQDLQLLSYLGHM